jgi:hypothetical protein
MQQQEEAQQRAKVKHVPGMLPSNCRHQLSHSIVTDITISRKKILECCGTSVHRIFCGTAASCEIQELWKQR